MITLENREPALRYYEIPVEAGGGSKHHVGTAVRSAKGGVPGLRVVQKTFPKP